ncbi:MAG TPA: tRNA (cytidine(34)-2'-O)-methyltransferase [Rhabdochlamydiaceae bacterium]|jgi:tRNA (cytidine/uridine-2'-O-)-methyltransferase
MKVVLYRPQIPQNTGNIVRTCSVTGTELILVTPLGFSTSNRMLKRAGLDYWEQVSVAFTADLEAYLASCSYPVFFFSSKAKRCYTEAEYTGESLLIFGSEDEGLPAAFHKKWADRFWKIPMKKNSRCLNLSNAVSIIIYEAWRQQGFATADFYASV